MPPSVWGLEGGGGGSPPHRKETFGLVRGLK
jgi:hypothetical protein